MTPDQPGRRPAVVGPLDVVAIVDLAHSVFQYDSCGNPATPAVLLGQIVRLFGARGGAVFGDQAPLRPHTTASVRWTSLDTTNTIAGLVRAGKNRGAELQAHCADHRAGTVRLSTGAGPGRCHYLYSRPTRGLHRSVAVVLSRREDAFSREEADLLSAIHRSRLCAVLLRRPVSSSEPDGPTTPRVREVLGCLRSGQSEKQIAQYLGISQHTVHIYVKRIYAHFGVNSRGELFAMWIRRLSEGGTAPCARPS